MVDLAFYRGKRVLVTGHTGFKGTWLCWMLSSLGAEVFGYALPPQADCLYQNGKPPVSAEVMADVRNSAELERAAARFEPELVFHLAAHSYIDGSYDFPRDIFDINLMGTVNLLEAIRKTDRRIPVVVVTSDKCYTQKLAGKPCREDDPFGAAEAYSTSKACQDLAAQCYQLSFPGMAVAAARASNTIGGGDFNKSRLIPYLLDCFVQGEPANLRNPHHIRPWQYVLDVLWGYLLLGKALAEGSISGETSYNFGPAPDGFQTVGEVAEQLAEQFHNAQYRWQSTSRSSETEILRLDSGKAFRDLGWRPLYSLRETLMQTANFHKRMQVGSLTRLCQEYVQQYIDCVQTGKGAS